VTSKLLFSSKKTVVEPTPGNSGEGAAPPIDKKFSALLGNRKASQASSSSTSTSATTTTTNTTNGAAVDDANADHDEPNNDNATTTTNATTTATSTTSANDETHATVQAVEAVTPSASARDRSAEAGNDYAALFGLAAGASKAALEAALPKEPLARRALVASARDKQQQTLLHVVADPAVAQFLVGECAADVAAKDRKGTTPLHLAAKNASAALCNKLIELVRLLFFFFACFLFCPVLDLDTKKKKKIRFFFFFSSNRVRL
jgi:hypothetical protein